MIIIYAALLSGNNNNQPARKYNFVARQPFQNVLPLINGSNNYQQNTNQL
jgi:hypothetical protein